MRYLLLFVFVLLLVGCEKGSGEEVDAGVADAGVADAAADTANETDASVDAETKTDLGQ